MTVYKVLTINPGSTSTKVALYENEELVFGKSYSHTAEELAPFKRLIDQYDFRRTIILDDLAKHGIDTASLSAVVGRGGMLKPIPGGTWLVNEAMKDELQSARFGEHASNLGGLIASAIAESAGCKAYIVDPVVVDELDDVARISGNPLLPRASVFHALNQKAVARHASRELGKDYKDLTLIVAHLGGGVSVGIHLGGRVVDVNNALDGDGPFSPERSGGVPVGGIAKLCFSGKYTHDEIKRQIKGAGGLVAYLGTNDARLVEAQVEQGDAEATLIFKALAYQVAKEIGALATVACGKVDAIVITGGIAYDKYIPVWIKERVGFIAPVLVYPGEEEMPALRDGALRVLRGDEEASLYE